MRIQNFNDMNFKGHHLVGFGWPEVSSRTGEAYKVTMTDLGFSCNCVAGSMRGKCKHAQQIHDLLVNDDEVQKYDIY